MLSVVVAGLVAGHSAPRTASSAGRLQTAAVWRLINFLLEGFVFLLIGQQVPAVVTTLRSYPPDTLAAATAATLGVVLVLRPAWLAGIQLLPRQFRLAVENTSRRPFTAAELTMLSWAGTRGVITLAAAYSLPLSLPNRNLLLYCAYLIVAVTLLGQGLTFAPLARRLGVRARPADSVRARNEARLAAIDAALARLDDLEDLSPAARDTLHRALRERQHRYQLRLDAILGSEDSHHVLTDDYLAAVAARRDIITAERDELLRWRETGRLSEHDLRRLQTELDHQESQLPQPS